MILVLAVQALYCKLRARSWEQNLVFPKFILEGKGITCSISNPFSFSFLLCPFPVTSCKKLGYGPPRLYPLLNYYYHLLLVLTSDGRNKPVIIISSDLPKECLELSSAITKELQKTKKKVSIKYYFFLALLSTPPYQVQDGASYMHKNPCCVCKGEQLQLECIQLKVDQLIWSLQIKRQSSSDFFFFQKRNQVFLNTCLSQLRELRAGPNFFP